MKLSLIRILVAGALSAMALPHAMAQQEATGAGASFPAPLYAKWAADYHKATGVKINYQSVGSGAGL
ncbi:MAG: substrate-binding domain-containing protein, partial [Comamonadaceae bacterium]|nr:substrate-binding domain-containing protein [Comamonadaceae bacterium]